VTGPRRWGRLVVVRQGSWWECLSTALLLQAVVLHDEGQSGALARFETYTCQLGIVAGSRN
jgi:hypothetical protein